MFFLALDFQTILPAALFGMLFALIAIGILLLVLRLFGLRIFWQKRRRVSRTDEANDSKKTGERETPEELPEEELLVILTAAAIEALDEKDKKRFRVVAFRRI